MLVAGLNTSSVVDESKQLNGVTRILSCDDALYENALAEEVSNLVLSVSSNHTYWHLLQHLENLLPRISAKLDVQQISDIISVGEYF